MESHLHIQTFFNREIFTLSELKTIWSKSIENKYPDEIKFIKTQFKDGLYKFHRRKNTFRRDIDFIDRNSKLEDEIMVSAMSNIDGATIQEILDLLKLTKIEFSGIASKHKIEISEMNRVLTKEEFTCLKDFINTRLKAIKRKEIKASKTANDKLKSQKKINKNNLQQKSKKKYKSKTTLSDIIYARGGIGKVIYTGMK